MADLLDDQLKDDQLKDDMTSRMGRTYLYTIGNLQSCCLYILHTNNTKPVAVDECGYRLHGIIISMEIITALLVLFQSLAAGLQQCLRSW